MKKKTQAPHDEIKSYLKVAKERVQQAFDVRPEWRHPKNVAGVNLTISRINEVYYPFSDKKNPKLAVWKQVLREKREEMIEEIEEENKMNPKNQTGDSKPGLEPARAAATTQGVGKRDPEKGAGRELPSLSQPTDSWTKERIAKLRNRIKSARAGSKIARRINASPSLVGAVLNGTKSLSLKTRYMWLSKIEAIFNSLMKPVFDAKCDPTEARKSITEVKTQFNKDDINHKNFMGLKYPRGLAKPDLSPKSPGSFTPIIEGKDSEEILELVGRIYRMIEAAKFERCPTRVRERQVLGAVAQLISPNMVVIYL